MKFKGMLEGLVVSVPLVFGSPDLSQNKVYSSETTRVPVASTFCIGRSEKSHLNLEDQAFQNHVWFNYTLFCGEAFLLYIGYSAVRRLLEYKDN